MNLMAFKLAIALASSLAHAHTDAVANAACSEAWTEDSDAWWDCTVRLETYRCEVQGWCGPEETAPYQAAFIAPPRVEDTGDCNEW